MSITSQNHVHARKSYFDLCYFVVICFWKMSSFAVWRSEF